MPQDFYQRNLDAMCAMLAAGDKDPSEFRYGLELERFLVDDAGRRVFFSGAAGKTDDSDGVHALLVRLSEEIPGAEATRVDNHVMGLSYDFDAGSETVPVAISLEPGAQVEISAGPVRSGSSLLAAIDDFDARVGAATAELGHPAHLVGRGYDPTSASPEDVELIPKERYHLMDAYLPTKGRYARDMMRCSGSTQVSVDYADERGAVKLARRSTVLGPLLAFLFDNAPVFRGRASKHMCRSRMWREVDPERCGVIPGSLERSFGFRRFCEWIACVHPILFTDAAGKTVGTGQKRSRDIMAERELTEGELMHLISMVWPTFRFKGYLECREMDSLPPRMSVACAFIVQALLYAPDLERRFPFPIADADEEAVDEARAALEADAWEARPYGVPADQLASAVLDVARDRARTDFDRTSVELFSDLWSKRVLPRDVPYDELAQMGR